jgi:flagellar biosynthesis regulator FlaF
MRWVSLATAGRYKHVDAMMCLEAADWGFAIWREGATDCRCGDNDADLGQSWIGTDAWH